MIISSFLVAECQQTKKANKYWSTGLVNADAYKLNVATWEECATFCSQWRGANGEICEFWDHCKSDFCDTHKAYPKYVSHACSIKNRSKCNDPTEVTEPTWPGNPGIMTAGTCPSPRNSICGKGKK